MDRRCTRSKGLVSPARLVLLGILFTLGACAPFSTYPPDDDGPRTYPWMAPGPEVMATGLMQAHARVAPNEPLIYNLPPGVSKMAWDDVQNRLGPKAQAMTPDDKIVWNLERFGVRNTKAFADIGYWNNGKGILITVSMERDNIAPFKVTHVQRWYVSMNEPTCNNPVFNDAENVEPTSTDDSSSTTTTKEENTNNEGA